MKRRRFLTLAAAFACAPRLAQASTWQGYALGAEVSITLHGPREWSAPLLAALPARLSQIEEDFSLYRDTSTLSRLNARGQLEVSDSFTKLLDHCDTAHRLTRGAFDPTVQPLWHALSQGADTQGPQAAIGWDHITRRGRSVTLGKGQALTLNGIAQGFATDLIAEELAQAGATKALINIGEFRALGGPFTLGLSDPQQGYIGNRRLQNAAIATSSPLATRAGTAPHILGPQGQRPLWSTVSVTSKSAALADALSTAGCLMPKSALKTLAQHPDIQAIQIVDQNGTLFTL
ncbi:FAD:protein FMN transferase [Donghicola tyrosinivorans]|uniref:FAD:protein FMN transferase n=1 Tax=Donghicola tyrosinivorans TaxID=1652492 RepID=A0A2T0WJK4_9RHOB|nr:FAD:protein FMN transferase [Donghicola tyrosinivorans]PRY86842.1 thiamine biosynthesis lipoprotein [Donghicola tyrosinivorans]